MMQTLSKTELRWIIDALNHDIRGDVAVMEQSTPGSVQYRLAELHRDNLAAVSYKVSNALATDAKRIAVK